MPDKSNHKHYITSKKQLIKNFINGMIDSTQPEEWYNPDSPRMLVSLPIPGSAQIAIKQIYDSMTIIEGTKPTQGEIETSVFASLILMGMLSWITNQVIKDLKDSKIEIPKFSY